jgi:hypothetical protein
MSARVFLERNPNIAWPSKQLLDDMNEFVEQDPVRGCLVEDHRVHEGVEVSRAAHLREEQT